MKLIFPNGEHSPVLLSEGVNRLGSAPDSQVKLSAAGIAPVHCELQLAGGIVTVRVPDPSHAVTLNGKTVQGVMAVRGGDLLGIGTVQARLATVEKANSVAGSATNLDNDSGATRMRMAVPKFVLRGVSGPAFGKTYPVGSAVVIGRSEECGISIASDEISRRHAQVKPTQDGVAVEDLGSANGTYVNGQRVQNGLLKPGDELRLDTIRFLLVAPGMEIAGAHKPTTPQAAPAAKVSKGPAIAAIVGVLAIVGAAAWYFLR